MYKVNDGDGGRGGREGPVSAFDQSNVRLLLCGTCTLINCQAHERHDNNNERGIHESERF